MDEIIQWVKSHPLLTIGNVFFYYFILSFLLVIIGDLYEWLCNHLCWRIEEYVVRFSIRYLWNINGKLVVYKYLAHNYNPTHSYNNYYNTTNRYKIIKALVAKGSITLPVVVEFWQHHKHDIASDEAYTIASALYKWGWIPQELNEKVIFYLAAEMDDEVLKIGDLTFTVLFHQFRYGNELLTSRIARILEKIVKTTSIPKLVEELKSSDYYEVYPRKCKIVEAKIIEALVSNGSITTPVMVKFWQRHKHDIASDEAYTIASALYKWGWIPQELNEKVVFYLAAGMDDEIVKFSGLTITVLIHEFRYRDELLTSRILRISEKILRILEKIGTRSIPRLVEELKSVDRYTDIYEKNNKFIILYNRISDVLRKLDDINGNYLYEWISAMGTREIGHYEPLYGALGDSVMNGQPCGQVWVTDDFEDCVTVFYAKRKRLNGAVGRE